MYRILPLSESNTPKIQPDLAAQNETQSADSIPVVIAGLKGDQSYSPNPINIESGQTITWHNGDSISHTVTSGQDNDGDEGT